MMKSTPKTQYLEAIPKIVGHAQEQGMGRSAVARKKGLWQDRRKCAVPPQAG